MDEEERQRLRDRDNRNRYLRETGRPQRVLPHEFEHGRRIARKAQASGMSQQQIATQVGLRKSTVGKVLHVSTTTMKRETYEALLRLRPEAPISLEGNRRGGARMDPTGSVRRLQALAAAGWTSSGLYPYLPINQRNLSELTNGRSAFIYAITQREIAEAYTKLQHMDPVDNGTTVIGAKRARLRAERFRWAPSSAWDEETIDDPAATPEWTGACGTEEGFRIHLREGIPACEPCREASRYSSMTGKTFSGDFSADRFNFYMQARGYTAQAFALRLGVSVVSVNRWRTGRRAPQSHTLADMCMALDCAESDLVDGGEVVYDTAFDRAALIRITTERGTSVAELAEATGVSVQAVRYWLNGETTPNIPKIVKVAEALGVDWKGFYR